MPAKAMTAPGVPITPWKHIQASQDAVAMNAERQCGNGEQAAPDRQVWSGRRGVTGATSGSAGVVSKRDGRRHIVSLRQRGASPLCDAQLLASVGVTSNLAARA
jgi:hypothetical protein